MYRQPAGGGTTAAQLSNNMKRFMLIVMLAVMAIAIQAQTSQIAVLSHGETVKTFRGASGFMDAYAEAVEGDIITLSSGQFTAVDIDKNITVRGAGMGTTEATDNQLPTILIGDFEIGARATDENKLILEGLQHNSTIRWNGHSSGIQLIKCRFGLLGIKNYVYKTTLENITILHCSFEELNMAGHSGLQKCDINMANSVMTKFLWPNNTWKDTSFEINNCVIINSTGGDSTGEISYCFLNNCLIFQSSEVNSSKLHFGNKSVAYNCVWIGSSAKQPFGYSNTMNNNHKIETLTYDSPFKDGTFYELIDPLKEYKGRDGTEIGIYGGRLPFSAETTNPQIVKFEVAPRTTPDGKLSVDIEVKINE